MAAMIQWNANSQELGRAVKPMVTINIHKPLVQGANQTGKWTRVVVC